MSRGKLSRGKLLLLLAVVLVLAVALWALRDQGAAPEEAVLVEVAPGADLSEGEAPGYLYGRVETATGSYEGRLRFGGVQEAFWNDLFDAFKKENPWEPYVDAEALLEEEPVEVFGLRLGSRERAPSLRRPFRVAFGDIVELEAGVTNLWVTLKNGSRWRLDRMGADDFGDGLRVWDTQRGAIDIDEIAVRRIEFLPTPPLDGPGRLYGTVRSSRGDFTGFIQWDREASVDTDEVIGRSAEGPRRLRFADVSRVTRIGKGSSWTLRDGRTVRLTGNRSVGRGHRGVAVADPRYGRVAVDWSVFQSLELSEGGPGPSYQSFVAGRALDGRVTLADGSILEGRLVFDLDESETTDTLDVSRDGIDYVLAFRRVAVIEPSHADDCAQQPARVELRTGEVLELDCSGDLAPSNAGVLTFAEGAAQEEPIYAKWRDVRLVELSDSSRLEAVIPQEEQQP